MGSHETGASDDERTQRVEIHATGEQMRLLLESVQDYAIFTLDRAGFVTTWNVGARRLMGYRAEEIIGRPLHTFYAPEALAAGIPDKEMQQALETGRSENEGWRVHKDGTRLWINEVMTPLRAADGTVLGFTKVSRDLTERRKAQEALHVSEERLRLIMDSIHDHAIFTQDERGYIVDWNVGAAKIFGYSAEEIVGKHVSTIFTPEDRANGIPAQEMLAARTTGRAMDERWHLRKDGSRFFASGVLTPLHNSELDGYVKVARDLTERRQMEERLEAEVKERTMQVRELVTQLTMSEQEERRRVSSILHDDLQQRLFSLMFDLTILREEVREKAEAEQMVNDIIAGLRSALQITRELSVDLSPPVLHGEGIVEAMRWLAAQMDQQQRLQVEVSIEGMIPLVNEDLRVLLFQSVRELLFNVVKHARVHRATVTLSYQEGELHIEVSDQGHGFHTGSDTRKRSSQGLIRMEQRLQLLGGHMAIVSIPEQGTSVTLFVPL